MNHPIIGHSRFTKNLIKDIQRLARSRKDILIVGEEGVGKGTIGRNIFELGARESEKRAFLSLNLSTNDEKDLDAILFGKRAGSPAAGALRGATQPASSRTVLIEEIEEGSLLAQMKLLKFINERKSKNTSAPKKDHVDTRLIVTMKGEPHDLITERKLLGELQKKFESFDKICVPPLRERREDIPLLIRHFKNTLQEELKMPDITVDLNSIEVLLRQPWRENIRELKAVVDRCVLYSKTGQFTLPPELVDEKTEVTRMLNNIDSGQHFVLDNSLDVIERGIIERTLDRFGFNQFRSAAFLGMTEQTLRYKLKRLGVPSSRERRPR